MKKLIQQVLSRPEFAEAPPVLMDIGASGALPDIWRWIAPFSICLAFDADSRDFSMTSTDDRGYRRLYTFNRLVSAAAADGASFYLTRSPHCSSALAPDTEALKPWAFRDLFEVQEEVRMPAMDLASALSACGIDYIDWYKSDSQGTDLRIFKALSSELQGQIVAADFEPGIINAYQGEDKLHHLLAYMESLPFWVTGMAVKGVQRIQSEDQSTLNWAQRQSLRSFLKAAPGWCEISFLNTLERPGLGIRDYLLGWVFATLRAEHGFALGLARVGGDKTGDPVFKELASASRRGLSAGYPMFFLRACKAVLSRLTGRG